MSPSTDLHESPRISRVLVPVQRALILPIISVEALCARKAPLMAPADTPTMKSGCSPASRISASMPTCNAPRLPPPASTNAVFSVLLGTGICRKKSDSRERCSLYTTDRPPDTALCGAQSLDRGYAHPMSSLFRINSNDRRHLGWQVAPLQPAATMRLEGYHLQSAY